MAEASPTAAGEAVPTPFIRWEKVGQAGEERLWEQAHVWVDGSRYEATGALPTLAMRDCGRQAAYPWLVWDAVAALTHVTTVSAHEVSCMLGHD